ncbi:unnamed protein product [Caenorhabditis sp. 36 PRJEB53466]|nr:unnamed protein product [Caenorhabditis sp. 36 PRJEB53466]
MPLFENFSDLLYWTIRILELISLIPSLILTYSFCRIACQTRIFHFNLTIILISILGQWFECFVARLLIIPYQEGWIAIRDTVVEDAKSGVVRVSVTFIPLLIGGFLRTHYILSISLVIPLVVIERLIASLFIRTYEKHPRVYVSTAMLLSSHAFSILVSYRTIQWHYSYLQILLTLAIVLSVTVSTFTILYTYNSSVTRRLERQHRRYGYHLGKRFQARENLQSLKLVRRLTVVALVAFLVIALLIALVFSQILPRSMHRIGLQLTEVIMNLNPLFIIPSTVSRIRPWKTKLLEVIPYGVRRKFSGAQSVRPLDYRVVIIRTILKLYRVPNERELTALRAEHAGVDAINRQAIDQLKTDLAKAEENRAGAYKLIVETRHSNQGLRDELATLEDSA